MARAAKICSDPHCGNLQPCALHQRKPWADSKRRERTISGSRQQKRSKFVINRDAGICHVCGQGGADQADHVIPLGEDGPDTVANMKAIHAEPCHREKTAAEAARGRAS
jgi:5-methylcytosine-specific restriction endonuclease McrA